ncbi:ATP-binding protein [Dactylosporangium sp. NPDC049140]|uniref:ATP-binding protein n=1 Tax=Dactylosporangium sp. NPDC049140 TaxID=3155647 RepID=UPI0033DD95CF
MRVRGLVDAAAEAIHPAIETAGLRLTLRFFRTADAQRRAIKGSGLGLAIAKAIVEAHGGWVALDSIEGGGTTVGFGLPLPTL